MPFTNFPRVELLPEEANAFPQRAARARGTTSLELDHRGRDLDHTRVEVHRAAGGEVIRPPLPVHHASADDPCGADEDILRLRGFSVEHDGKLRLEPDGGERHGLRARALLAALGQLARVSSAHDALHSASKPRWPSGAL